MFKRILGTKDLLPEEVCLWQSMEAAARRVFAVYNYQEIRPPLIETAALFNRSLGETAEIVQKQMFLVKNKSDIYALRPEGTASIVRSYLENNLDKTNGFYKFYYFGPMFRLERPQKGRLRQFHHIGTEAIGSGEPELDVESIALADHLLKELGIGNYKIKLNSLGCPDDKIRLAETLREKLKGRIPKLCADCKARYKKNVLRILDCKNYACQRLINEIGLHETSLCPDCKTHFSRVRSGLDSLGVNYEISPHLVRGLDYYTRTVFEISHPELGAQDALGAGGRYDLLVKELGGPQVGAIGFAFGVERLLVVAPANVQTTERRLTYLITLGAKAKEEGPKLLEGLRKNGIPCDTDYENKSLKGAMRKANDLKSGHVIILGDEELKNNLLTLKDMDSGEQKQVLASELIKELKC